MNQSRTIKQQLTDLNEIATTALAVSDQSLATLAGTMIDVLGIAESVASESTSDESDSTASVSAIQEFCEETALPFLQNACDTDVDQQHVAEMQQRVEENWGDYLGLLNPAERFGYDDAPAWRDEVYAWENLTQDRPESSDSESGDVTRTPSQEEINTFLSSVNDLTNGQATDAVEVAAATTSAGSKQQSVKPESAESTALSDPELLAAYMDDAQQCLAGMEASLLSFESGAQPDEALRRFCRELHTLKGASGTVELYELATYLHELETYVDAGDPSTLDVDALLAGVDAVGAQLAALRPKQTDVPAVTDAGSPHQQSQAAMVNPATPMLDAVAADPVATTNPAAPSETYIRLEASRLDRLMDLLSELVMLRNRRDTYVVGLRNLQQELNGCANRVRTFDRHAADGVAFSGSANPTGDTRYTARSLVEVSNDVTELSRSLQEISEPLSSDNSLVSHLVGRFRQELIELRRQPIAGLFQRLQRAARNAGRSETKLIDVEFLGQGTRVERAMQERLYEPLMHMVRNAVSHGIEPPEIRRDAGKHKIGRITLEAWSDASTLFLEIRDDGRGLDTEALERQGRDLGLLPVGDATEEQLFRLIFHSGFSTRSGVSEISGRGIGMDVVDSWIRRLRGRINVSSVPGQGTTFHMQIPLRSAIEHAMVVRVAGQLFALPMQSVSGTECGAEQSGDTASGILCLNQLLGLPPGTDAGDRRILSLRDSAVRRGLTAETNSPATVDSTESAAQAMRIAVDAVVGVEEVVVRSLPPMLAQHDLFAGVTLSGQAETVLLLDVPRLIDVGQRFTAQTSNGPAIDSDNAPPAKRQDAPHILIADDSVTVRRSLARRLSGHGFRTTEVADGALALDALRTGDFVSVVTDIDMPRMNGLEFLTELRCNSRLQDLPVVVITSRDDEQTLTQLKELQATAVLNKPVTDESVAELLRAFALRPTPVN